MLIEPPKPRRGIMETLWKTFGPEGTTNRASDWVMKGDDPVAQNVRSLTGVDFLQAVGERLGGGEALSPYEFPPVGGGRLHYPPGRISGRDVPVAEPTSALRIVEEKPTISPDLVYHGTPNKSFGEFDLRRSNGVLGRGAYFTNERGYANAFANDPIDPNANFAPHVRMARLRTGNIYDADAPPNVMREQVDKIARAFADRTVAKTEEPTKWGELYMHARQQLEEPMPGLVGQGPGTATNLKVLAAQMRNNDMSARVARGAPVAKATKLRGTEKPQSLEEMERGFKMSELRMRHLLRHAGYSSVRAINDFSGGYQVNVLSPKAQVVHPAQEFNVAPPPGMGQKFALAKEKRAAKPAAPDVPDKPLEQYKVERMQNGYYRVDDLRSGLVQVFNEDGSPRFGPKLFPHISQVPRYGQFNPKFDPKRRSGR